MTPSDCASPATCVPHPDPGQSKFPNTARVFSQCLAPTGSSLPGPGSRCNNGMCASGSVCNGYDGKCYANPGTSCTNSDTCYAGASCSGGVCTTTGLGGWCMTPSDCVSSATCVPHPNPGQSQFPNTASVFSQCSADPGSGSGSSLPGPGSQCNAGMCASGSVCNGYDGICYANPGTSCTNSNTCYSGASCSNGVCTPAGSGGWCMTPSDCVSSTTCVPHTNPGQSKFPNTASVFSQCTGFTGANCSSGSACVSGTCTNGVCS